jgi:hypothetical protein
MLKKTAYMLFITIFILVLSTGIAFSQRKRSDIAGRGAGEILYQ